MANVMNLESHTNSAYSEQIQCHGCSQGSRIPNNPAHFEQWLSGKEPGPLVVEAGISHGCNHHCQHCSYQQFAPFGKKKRFIDSTIFHNFLDDFRSMGGVKIYFAGEGEPLLHPDFGKFLQHAADLGLQVELSSNGQLLNEKKLHEVLPFMQWIRFSVNGGDPQTYAQVHHCNSREFRRLEEILRAAVNYRNSHKYACLLTIQCIAYQANWSSIPGVIALHQRIGTDALVLRGVVENLEHEEKEIPREVITLLKESENVAGVQVRWDSFLKLSANPKWKRCDGIYFRTNVDSSGNLFTCPRHFHIESSYGNLKSARFRDIWHSEKRRHLFAACAKGEEITLCAKWCPSSLDNIFLGTLTDHE
ncbi:MAG: radical SAM protein [Magnetococcales bacterium]|nr:radical SAM protein [Magnetococcales bacterium]